MDNEEITADNPSFEDAAPAVGEAQEQNNEKNTLQNEPVLNQEQNTPDNETRAFAKRLKEKTSEIEARFSSQTECFDSLKDLLSQLGINGDNDTELIKAAQEYVGNAFKEKNDKLASYNAELKTQEFINHPMTKWAVKCAGEKILNEDLSEIQREYPEDNVTDLFSIGEIFTQLISTGNISALSAYAAQKLYNESKIKPQKNSIGSINVSDQPVEKEYYSPAQAKALTQNDLDNDPDLFMKVRRSMLKWK